MKAFISFPVLKGDSGSDIFTENLSNNLNKLGLSSKISYYHPIHGFFPSFAGIKHRSQIADIIHTNAWNGFAFKTDKPLVITEHHVVHDPILSQYRSRPQKIYHSLIFQYEKKSISSADVVTCVSKFTQKMVEKVFGYSDTRVVYNGIDTVFFKPSPIPKESFNIPEDKIVLLFVGNLSLRKGSDLLIPIMRNLSEDFILLTTSGLRNQGYFKDAHIMNIGKLTRNQLLEAYNICDIFLFPSRLEGFGLSVAEAMSCGKPVITTDYSSLPELIIDGKGGALCRPDDVKMFASAVQTLSEDPSLRRKQGEFNRNRAINLFSCERMAHDYARIYKSL